VKDIHSVIDIMELY